MFISICPIALSLWYIKSSSLYAQLGFGIAGGFFCLGCGGFLKALSVVLIVRFPLHTFMAIISC